MVAVFFQPYITCMNFVFLWLCRVHTRHCSDPQLTRGIDCGTVCVLTIHDCRSIQQLRSASKSIEHKIFIQFLNHLKAVDAAQEFPIAMQHVNATSLDYQQYRIYFGFGRTSVHDAKSFALDGTCTYEAYGTDLIAAIDCIWEKINGKNSEIVDLSKEQRNP